MHDLTESRRLRETLHDRAVMLAEAAELARMGTWEWDMERRVITWSDEMYEIYGLDRDTFVPTPESVLGRVSEEDRPALDSAMRVLRGVGRDAPHRVAGAKARRQRALGCGHGAADDRGGGGSAPVRGNGEGRDR